MLVVVVGEFDSRVKKGNLKIPARRRLSMRSPSLSVVVATSLGRPSLLPLILIGYQLGALLTSNEHR